MKPTHVYRLQYRQPQRDEDGGVEYDVDGRIEYGSVVTRYFVTHKAFKAKVDRIQDPRQGEDYANIEPCAGVVISVEVATLGEWEKVAP